MDKKRIVERIVECLGGSRNIVCVTNCMTRLRAVVKAEDRVDEEKLKSTETVMGLVHDRPCSYEVVVGPGNSRQYADLCHELGLPEAALPGGDWQANKAALRKGQKNSRLREAMKAIGDIFVPLIPGIVAAGLCAGLAALLTQLVPDYKNLKGWYLVFLLLSLLHTSLLTCLTAWVGYRAAERFGATPILGGMLGMSTSLPNIDGIAQLLGLYNDASPFSSILRSGKGGILAVIGGVFVLSIVEKFIRKRMPSSVEVFGTPFLTLLICVVPYVLIAMPLFGYISSGIAWAVSSACLSESLFVRTAVGYVASALLLPLVATGMHHGLTALYAIQLQELGFITLYPALCMAGAGQVGAAIALYGKAKRLRHKKLCSVISGALPAGLLGIGEPLIYGVTLPMGRPFITAGLGAGFGGAFVMAFQVSSTAWGLSGLLGLFIMKGSQDGAIGNMVIYLGGLIISYVMGCLLTKLIIGDDEVAAALGGIEPEEGAAAEEVTKTPISQTEKVAGPILAKSSGTCASYGKVRHGEAVRFGFGSAAQFEYVIKDPVGLHARPAGELAKLVKALGCEVTVKNGDKSASGKSLLELMTLGAAKGSRLEINVVGAGADKAVQSLKRFLDEKL